MSNILRLSKEKQIAIACWRKTASESQRRRMLEMLEGDPISPTPLEVFVPHIPWPRQKLFLDLDCPEAFFGGAAAGGKSEALLMAALQYADVPGYAALILRRDTRRLMLAGGLIPRSQQWLTGKPGVSWNGSERRWTFRTSGAPATLTFGYLQDSSDKFRYGSTEFQYIAFDELTEFPEDDYLFLFSRLRRTRDIPVPLRMRSASNPGNVGHAWVKERFIVERNSFRSVERDLFRSAPSSEKDRNEFRFTERNEFRSTLWLNGRAYIPARIADNSAVDEAEYRATLAHLPPVERARLMEGDWDISATGLVRPQWLRRYEVVGNALVLRGNGKGETGNDLAPSFPNSQIPVPDSSSFPYSRIPIPLSSCRRFVTIDPAGTSQERAAEQRGRPASWTVAQVWDQPLGELRGHLLLRRVERKRVAFDGLCQMLRDIHRRWQPARMLIENEKLGQAAVDLLGRELPLSTISTGSRDKVARAAPLVVKLERGEIWLPQSAPWLADFESELLTWTGLPHETCDQIDAAAYAVLEAEGYWGEVKVERVFG